MKTFSHVIGDPLGLHARTAGLLVRESAHYKSDVWVKLGERLADGRNLIDLMGLHAEYGHCIQVEISGEDEESACRGIKKLLQENL